MKIRTIETAHKYETWEYEIDDSFGFDVEMFEDMSPDEKYEYLQSFPVHDAIMVDSDWSGIGTIDEYKIEE